MIKKVPVSLGTCQLGEVELEVAEPAFGAKQYKESVRGSQGYKSNPLQDHEVLPYRIFEILSWQAGHSVLLTKEKFDAFAAFCTPTAGPSKVEQAKRPGTLEGMVDRKLLQKHQIGKETMYGLPIENVA